MGGPQSDSAQKTRQGSAGRLDRHCVSLAYIDGSDWRVIWLIELPTNSLLEDKKAFQPIALECYDLVTIKPF